VRQQIGNLSNTERAISALIGLSLSVFCLRRPGSLSLRAFSGVAAASLLARAFAGHCGVKAALGDFEAALAGSAAQRETAATPK